VGYNGKNEGEEGGMKKSSNDMIPLSLT